MERLSAMLRGHRPERPMARSNPSGDFLQFLVGGCLFGAGGFLLANQVMVSTEVMLPSARGGWGLWGSRAGGLAVPWGTPGMGLLMLPLGIGVCLLFAGTQRRWANLLIWASLAALTVGLLNSLRMSFLPTTLWQLGVFVVMIAAGGGLMFRGLNAYDAEGQSLASNNEAARREADELRREIEALKARLDGRPGER
ncbi:MAG: hypothetical protein VKM34_09060 [Cyanobacteriota bacterium]|nr:hypothetical protein [Cyanobacteriota bacterium]